MDELEISGKRYISSRRAAKENAYHSDYIGQLIRGGKLIGTKVGRAWYVEEASLLEFLGKEREARPAPFTQSVAEVAVPEHVEVEKIEPELPLEEEVRIPIRTEPEKVLQPVSVAEQAVPITAVKKTGLTYIADNSPLFPEIPRRTNIPARSDFHVEEPEPEQEVVVVRQHPPKRSRTFTFGIPFFSAVALSMVLFGFALLGSVDISSRITVEQGKPASVSLAPASAFCFIFKSCQN
jgi:hypothetical protein